MEERILEILAEHCEEAVDYEGDGLIDDGILNSFTVIDIVSDLEDEFDIEIDAKYVIAENFNSKEAIIELVNRILDEQ